MPCGNWIIPRSFGSPICGYVDPARKSRPFLVMDFFDGRTLEDYVRKQGPLSCADLLALARKVADGLQAAHKKGILHRDVKPANLLVRKSGSEWQVKLIDFGLALKQSAIASPGNTPREVRTIRGKTIAGTLDYAASEQMGRRNDAVGPYSDIYGFAKTCCYALFETAQPLMKHWQTLPMPFAKLLERCLDENPKQRPQSFAEVLDGLQALPPPLPAGGVVSPPRRASPATPPPPKVPAARPKAPPLPAAAVVPQPQPVKRRFSKKALLYVGIGLVQVALICALIIYLPSRNEPEAKTPEKGQKQKPGKVPVGGDAKEEAIKKDQRLSVGTWRVISHENDGKKTPAEQLEKTRVIFGDGKVMVQREGKTITIIQASGKQDPTKKPKQFELTHTQGELKGKTVLGIYEIDGDNMKICIALPGQDRPTEFSSKPGSGHILIVYKRDKP